MFFPEGQVRVFLYGQPVSMRLSFDGLYALAKHVMHQNPLLGNLFAFINRRATQIRVLYFDRNGLCVWSKRLEQGRLVGNWADVTNCEMDWTGLKLLLEGIEPKQVRRRYKKPLVHSQNTPIHGVLKDQVQHLLL
jgi:transposase